MSNLDTPALFNYLNNHKYQNLHTRHTKQVNKQRVMKHLHGMKLINKNLIAGYFCGPIKNSSISEIRYELDDKANITVTLNRGLNKREALEYLEKEFKRIESRTDDTDVTWSPKYLKDNFYLRRSNSTIVTTAGRKAVARNILTDNFVKTMASWNLRVTEGNK